MQLYIYIYFKPFIYKFEIQFVKFERLFDIDTESLD